LSLSFLIFISDISEECLGNLWEFRNSFERKRYLQIDWFIFMYIFRYSCMFCIVITYRYRTVAKSFETLLPHLERDIRICKLFRKLRSSQVFLLECDVRKGKRCSQYILSRNIREREIWDCRCTDIYLKFFI